jgi:hypothetical protein
MNRIVEAMQGSLTESWGEPVDITEFLTDSTGFFNTTGLGAFTQVWDRSDGRYRPVYTNEAELKIIRAMSWLLVEKVPMAQAWVNRLLDYTIGTGFDWTIKCDDKRLEKAVQAYVRECLDTSKWSSELERETMVREVSEGEFSGELIYDNGQCMLVAREADELTEPAAKRELEDWLGIEFDASWTFGVLTKKSVPEKHYGYHFVKNAAGTDWDYVPAERVVFWKRNVRQRAKRGYSDFYKPHLYLLRADRVLTNTAEGAATQAAIAYIVEHSEGTQRQADNIVKKFAPLTGRVDPMTGLSQRKRRMLPGTRLDVPAGQNYKAGLLGSNNSDIYISVMESALRLAGTVHAFPEGMLTGSYENNNLASAIVAEGPFVQGRIAEQTQRKERMREMILKIVKLGANNRRFGVYGYATWEAIQDLITIEVIPPKIIPLDPIKHTQALAMQRDKGWVSDKTAMNELGRDIDTETANGLKVAGAEQQAGTGAQPSVQAGNVANKTGQETGSDAGNVASPEAQISSNWQGLSRLQWNRNRRAMADVLADFMAGKTTRQVASVLLKSIGMDDKSIEAILTDAEDGSIDDPMPLTEAERKTLGKPFRTPGGPKKFSVYVKNDKGNVVKVNFGDTKMRIKRQNPGSRRGFRARHNCQDPGPRWKARYWSCRFWSRPSVTKLLKESFSGEYTWDGRTFVSEAWLHRVNPALLEVRCPTGKGGGIDNSCKRKNKKPVNPKVLDWAKKKFKDDAKAQNFAEWFGDSKAVDEDGNPLLLFHGTNAQFDEFSKSTNVHSQSIDWPVHFMTDDINLAKAYAASRVAELQSGKKTIIPGYMSMQRPLVIDAKGREWTDVVGDVTSELNTYRTKEEKEFREFSAELREKYKLEFDWDPEFEVPKDEQEKFQKLRAKYEEQITDRSHPIRKMEPQGIAYYDGVIIKNVYDRPPIEGSGGTFNPFNNVYAVFDSSQIKSTKNKGTFNPDSNKITESLTEAKDGDGDGLIDDGKPTQRAAPKKQSKNKSSTLATKVKIEGNLPTEPPSGNDLDSIARKFVDDGIKYNKLTAKTLKVKANGKTKSLSLDGVARDENWQPVFFADKANNYYQKSGDDIVPLQGSIEDVRKARFEQGKRAALNSFEFQQKFNKRTYDLANEIADAGYSVRINVPDDSTSRYIYVDVPGREKEFKIRIADHAQPGYSAGGKKVNLGGFSKELGKRHEASDISIDPTTGSTLKDALDAVKNLGRKQESFTGRQKAMLERWKDYP